MKSLQKLLIVGVVSLSLVSCFGKTDTPDKTPDTKWISGVPNTINGMPSEEVLRKVNTETEERQRIAKLNTLSADNIKTQIESKDSKNTLKDRRLLINYLKNKQVSSVKNLVSGLGDIDTFLKDQKIEFTDADIMTVMAGVDVENTSWDMCGDYIQKSSTLDAKNRFVTILASVCDTSAVNPLLPQKVKK